MTRLYDYVGPGEIRFRSAGRPSGTKVGSARELAAWVHSAEEAGPDGLVAATFVIDAGGWWLLADRRSEHVACAGGGPALSAGEMFFRLGEGVEVAEVSNQSTGFCPEPESWPAVAAALDRIGVAHPGRFTTEVVFRRCEKCGERNVVKDGWFVCGLCGADLPPQWNF
jgi:hypothetical protein